MRQLCYDSSMTQEQPTNTATTLGSFVRQARERAGLSLRNLEAITGISRPTLNRLELDQVDHPSLDMLHRLANTLEVNSDDLFAFAGYRASDQLPSLAPYLRAKYQLPTAAVTEAQAALQRIVGRYDREHTTVAEE